MDRIITILSSDPKTGDLVLSDHNTTNVDIGDQVTWVLGPNCGVVGIVAIQEKKGSSDVFNPDPKQLPNSTSWEGTINPDIKPGTEECYSILWTPPGAGWHGQAPDPLTYDPKISVNPIGK